MRRKSYSLDMTDRAAFTIEFSDEEVKTRSKSMREARSTDRLGFAKELNEILSLDVIGMAMAE